MTKIKDLTRIMHENYNREELEEYYMRKIILLKEIGASEKVINDYLYKLQAFRTSTKESSKQK